MYNVLMVDNASFAYHCTASNFEMGSHRNRADGALCKYLLLYGAKYNHKLKCENGKIIPVSLSLKNWMTLNKLIYTLDYIFVSKKKIMV